MNLSTPDTQWQHIISLSLAQEFDSHTAQRCPGVIECFARDFHLLHKAALDIADGKDPERWSDQLTRLINASYIGMRDANSPSELMSWRTIFTDSSILRALSQSIAGNNLPAISSLDCAIIIAGPCGAGRLDMILGIIHKIQSFLVVNSPSCDGSPPLASRPAHTLPRSLQSTIPCIEAPSFLTFQSTFSKSPFIIRNYAGTWPALNEHPWKSAAYLRYIAGPGRIVPVEIGHDYRTTDWKQDLMEWDEFLNTLDFEDQPSHKTNKNLLYMAQHDLTKQFPTLREDIDLPDYVYASLHPDDWANYHPPTNDEQIILNTWLGPKGTMSPAHIDPYYNFYVQIVGYKSVWLAPPSLSLSMYPFTAGTSADSSSERLPSSELGNTSQVDVFADTVESKLYPDFVHNVVPVASTAELGPGDMLFLPPGWWHAMRSETTSLSFSMWF